MAIVSQTHRLLFVMTPRTGCTAIGKLLMESLGGEYLPPENILDERSFFVVQRKHCTLAQLLAHGILTDAQRRSLFVFGAVRNPFDSLVSLYTKLAVGYQPSLQDPNSWVHKVKGYAEDMEYCRTHTFPEWIEHRYGPTMWDRIKGGGKKTLNARYVDGVDFVMRFERLQHDFEGALRQAGITQSLTIPSVNVTADRDRNYRRYYTPSARRIVEYVFDRELVQFGYEY
jgi:Sulfotransferase family